MNHISAIHGGDPRSFYNWVHHASIGTSVATVPLIRHILTDAVSLEDGILRTYWAQAINIRYGELHGVHHARG